MDEEAKVLSTRQIGFELKAANNMIRRKMDSIFAQQDGSELIGMQRPLLGYLYHKSRHGDVYQKDVEKEFRIRRSTATVMLQGVSPSLSKENANRVYPCTITIITATTASLFLVKTGKYICTVWMENR